LVLWKRPPIGYKARLVTLSGKQRRHLRALGHPLTVIVTVGKDGITEALTGALDTALSDHELVKVRIGSPEVVDRKEAAAELARVTGSDVAQVLGNTILLYRAHPEKPTIKLPAKAAS